MTVRMIDIAKEAGVSQASVSRVLNHSTEVSEEVAQAVREAMERLGYSPQARRSRADSQGESAAAGGQRIGGLVALLHFDEHHMGHSDVLTAALRGIERALAARGMGLVVVSATDSRALPDCLFNGQVKGLLLDGVSPNRSVLSKLRSLPAVWLSSHHDEAGDHALMGNEVIGRMAARYLTDRGHEVLAFLSIKNTFSAFRARGEGFCFAAGQNGAQVMSFTDCSTDKPPIFLTLAETEKRVEPLLQELLHSHPRPTGLFIPYDPTTAIVYRLLHKHGIEPGPEMDIISCGNQISCMAGLVPRPATIDVGSEISGRNAVEQLIWRIEHPGQEPRSRVMVDPLLVEGEIPAPVRAAN